MRVCACVSVCMQNNENSTNCTQKWKEIIPINFSEQVEKFQNFWAYVQTNTISILRNVVTFKY